MTSPAVSTLRDLLLPLDAVSGDGRDGRSPGAADAEPFRVDGWVVPAKTRVYDGDAPRSTRAVALAGGVTIDMHVEAGKLIACFDLEEAYRGYLSEAWTDRTDQRRLSASTLGRYYRIKRFVPRTAQLWARRQVIRWQGLPDFPTWPLDESVHRLLQLYALERLSGTEETELTFRWFWPGSHHAAIVLGHDVESAEGIPLAIELADLEESLGFRSAFYFGAWYDVDPGVLRELTSRGFEVGVHGIVHDHSLFSSRAEFDRQLPLLRQLADRLGAVGFRSPATHRVFDWLAELPIDYDATIPHSDPYEPKPGGCCSLWPFTIGDVVELPYTLPQDHTLLTLLGDRTPERWVAASRLIEERFGLIHCLAHPDPGYLGDRRKRAIYGDYLRQMAERERVWRALPREVVEWWRRRATDDQIEHGTLRATHDAGGASIRPPTAVNG